MPSIQVRCSDCGHRYWVSDQKEGVKLRCKECGTAFVAHPAAEDASDATHISSRPFAAAEKAWLDERSRGAASSHPASRRRDEDDLDIEKRPRASPSLNPSAVLAVAGGGAVLLAVIGAVVYLVLHTFKTIEPPSPPKVAQQEPLIPPPPAFPQFPAGNPPGNFPQGVPPGFPKLPAKLQPAGPPKRPAPKESTKPKPEVHWEVRPNPEATLLGGAIDFRASLKLSLFAEAVFPSATESPFVALTPSGSKDGLQVYDLRQLKPVGALLGGKFRSLRSDRKALSADGTYFAAALADAGTTKVSIWSTATGRLLRQIEIDLDPNVKAGRIDFLGKDRLFVVKHESDFPHPSQKATYQTWDLRTGRLVSQFSYPLIFHGKWATFSPGRRYLVMEKTETLEGYHLLFWDLTTGKIVGDIEFQGPRDPWGQAAGIAFSPDGTQVAMLWRLAKPGCWARLLCWDVRTGKKLFDHKIGNLVGGIEDFWSQGAPRSFQWLPDGSGWLLFCQVVIDRTSGATLGRLPPERDARAPQACRFLDRDHLAVLRPVGLELRLSVMSLPRR